jgi:FkbM family methyltransferase
MKDVGDFEKRNKEFDSNFSRDKIIKSIIDSEAPVIFDIGAHHGESIDYLRKFFPKGTIYSFEPDPDSFSILSNKKSSTNKLYNLALSDRSGSSIFYRNKISHTNSLNKVNINSQDSIRAQNEKLLQNSSYLKEINAEIKINTITLDEFIDTNSIELIDLLKVDVQGAEEKVFKGAVNSLSKIQSIIVEISLYDFYENGASFLSIEKLLVPAGFELFSILEISQNPMNGRTDWAEVLYRKKILNEEV